MESQLEYIIRMLNKPEINIPGVAQALGINKQNLYNLLKAGNCRGDFIETAYNFLKTINQ